MAHLNIFQTLLIFSLLGASLGDKILFLLPLASRSHVHVFEPLMKALGERGHEIVNLSPIVSKNMPQTVKQIQLIKVDDLTGKIPDPFEQRKMGTLRSMLNTSSVEHMHVACIKLYENPQLYEVLKNEKFDLVIIDIFLNYCVLGVIPHFKAPSILVSTMAAPSHFSNIFGNRLQPSFVPCSFLKYTDQMSFLERLINTVLDSVFALRWDKMFVARSEEMYKKYLPNGDQLPNIDTILGNSSMMFMNSHFTLNYPRPLLPDVIEVGGMHTRPTKKLPKDLDDFLSNSGNDGFILFSLGSIVKAKDMPEETRKIFLKVFSRIKQRVVWKWETESMPDLPPNVKLSKWLPQQDVLGHPNIRLFMTHGGLLSTQESVYHGVPVLGIPIFGDQDLNVMQAESRGYAKMVEIIDITEEKLESTILELINNPTYVQKAQALSKLVKDLPQSPLDKAVYWTEYVLRHKGALHIRSAARDLNFFQYYVLDVTAFILGALGLIIYLILCCCTRIFRRTFSKKSTKNTHFKKE
ncbi:unnamed protein product [Orchesella dallaii]|uniref:UDP-glucuronosyltransferase n=1 Tax=Orchesella dallaii TaxID=48710 RepID=A0ABP1QIF3_9HEXA